MAVSTQEFIDMITVGNAKAILDGTVGTPLDELLRSLVQDVTNDLVESLDKYDISASSNLRQSIVPEPNVTKDGSVVSIGIKADFYWKFVNYGVDGTVVKHGAPYHGVQPKGEKSFHTSIMDWTRNRGITLPTQFATYESFAFAVMGSIKRDGKAPRPFFTDVVNDTLILKLEKPISEFFKEAITVKIVEPWQ
jgi:hypothetical protein